MSRKELTLLPEERGSWFTTNCYNEKNTNILSAIGLKFIQHHKHFSEPVITTCELA
jgi:hypothetical protein